jgi:hypothetical protein
MNTSRGVEIGLHILDLGTRWRCAQLHAPAALPAGTEPPVSTTQEARWVPE